VSFKKRGLTVVNVLITGSAGFIGYHLAKELFKRGYTVTGIDNLNNYYDPKLKIDRLNKLNAYASESEDCLFSFKNIDISDRKSIGRLFSENKFDIIINLAAQAGVRYSIDNPESYIDSNLVGMGNILEGCRQDNVKHFIFASSSSVYGMNVKQPFSTDDMVDYPVSLYAATKKANELMAYTYSHLYNLPTTGLRFFTVYGPFGRPDMAYFKFTKAILEGSTIDVYNNGEMKRDFTYIDDIVEGIIHVIDNIPERSIPVDQYNNKISNAKAPYKLYNIGNNKPVQLMRLISAIENSCGKKASINFLPMQPGDVPITHADIDNLVADTGFKPTISVEDGIDRFVNWYRDYYEC
jgi:UDP-glucuronate 4-epimerase